MNESTKIVVQVLIGLAVMSGGLMQLARYSENVWYIGGWMIVGYAGVLILGIAALKALRSDESDD